MPKIDVETLKMILQRNEPDVRRVTDIMNDVQLQLQAEEEERANRAPPVKKQFVVLLSDPDGSLRDRDLTGWVVQIPEEDSPMSAPDRIIRAAYEFNATPKGRRLPVKSIGEACEAVSSRVFKEQNIWVKTKTPVLAAPVSNELPEESSE